MARVTHKLGAAGKLGRYQSVREAPGIVASLARTVNELRFGKIKPDALRHASPELAVICGQYDAELDGSGLADRPLVFEYAAAAAQKLGPSHPLLGIPTLVIDVPIHSQAELDLLQTVLSFTPNAFVTAIAGDDRTIKQLEDLAEDYTAKDKVGQEQDSLNQLQTHSVEPRSSPSVLSSFTAGSPCW